MESFAELQKAFTNGTPLVWNDPDPIKGNNYTITYIEDVSEWDENDDYDTPILIQYGGGSEAEVYLWEIIYR